MAETQPVTWGVTVDEVHALAPHVPIDDSPETSPDPVWEGDVNQAVTSAQVQRWIVQVSNRASLRVELIDTVTDETRKTVMTGAIHDAVTNGAASYLVAAAYPAMSAPNEQTSYAQVLWDRYMSILKEAEQSLSGWLEVTPGSGGSASVSGTFPAPLFPDAIQW